MAIQIKEEYGMLKILGVLNSETARVTTHHVKQLLVKSERVMLSLEGVLSMDKMAAKAMEKLYHDSARNNKVLSIFGNQNGNISDVLRETNTRYILSSDRE